MLVAPRDASHLLTLHLAISRPKVAKFVDANRLLTRRIHSVNIGCKVLCFEISPVVATKLRSSLMELCAVEVTKKRQYELTLKYKRIMEILN